MILTKPLWYKEQSEILIGQMLNEIDQCFIKISLNPKHYQKRYKEVRVIFTKKFPYGIYYTIDSNTIFVHALLHTKQNPETIIKRKG